MNLIIRLQIWLFLKCLDKILIMKKYSKKIYWGNIENLKKLFTSTLNLPSDIDINDLEYRNCDWDSISHMQLISELENKYNIMFDTNDITNLTSLEKMILPFYCGVLVELLQSYKKLVRGKNWGKNIFNLVCFYLLSLNYWISEHLNK